MNISNNYDPKFLSSFFYIEIVFRVYRTVCPKLIISNFLYLTFQSIEDPFQNTWQPNVSNLECFTGFPKKKFAGIQVTLLEDISSIYITSLNMEYERISCKYSSLNFVGVTGLTSHFRSVRIPSGRPSIPRSSSFRLYAVITRKWHKGFWLKFDICQFH
jgi:hypothetical protein